MINTKERDQKISHLIESVIRYQCRIYNTVSEAIDDGIIVYNDDKPLYSLGIEFNESGYDICFYGIVFLYNSFELVIYPSNHHQRELLNHLNNLKQKKIEKQQFPLNLLEFPI
jgi:hypothetical protein